MKTNSSYTFLLWFMAAIATFSFILLFNSELYASITQEDRLIEYLGFLLLLITGVFLVAAGVTALIEKKRKFYSCLILVIIGLLFFSASLEEISWGQRVFGFATPDYLQEINGQDELNVHNIDKKFFDRLVDRLTILFVYFSALMILLKRPTFLGIKLPDVHIIMAFAILPFYHQYNQVHLDFYHLLYVPLIYLALRSFGLSKHNEFISVMLTITVSLLLFWLHTNYNAHFPTHNNSANEIRETLFSLACAYYAYTIFDDVRWDRVLMGYY